MRSLPYLTSPWGKIWRRIVSQSSERCVGSPAVGCYEKKRELESPVGLWCCTPRGTEYQQEVPVTLALGEQSSGWPEPRVKTTLLWQLFQVSLPPKVTSGPATYSVQVLRLGKYEYRYRARY